MRYFTCIGAQKSGTTWLYEALSAHPDVGLSPIKELHYFDEKYIGEGHFKLRLSTFSQQIMKYITEAEISLGSRQPYRDRFSPVPQETIALSKFFGIHDDASYKRYVTSFARGKRVCGDITPEYALLPPRGFQNIVRIFPGAKIIFMMRDPIGRFWSQIRMEAKRSGKRADQIANNRLDQSRGVIPARSNYKRTILNIDKAGLENERVMYVFYEDFFRNGVSPSSFANLTGFLGINHFSEQLREDLSARHVHKGESEEIPESLVPRLYELMLPIYEFCRGRFGALPEEWEMRGST
ncbi:sulfotransferase [Lutibaculum baratangense]|uniref:sulfotransferase n=1 Tax=Lutibaculum baratangense TaxID=1358440 RepID=UPI0009DCEBB2|nr:sulfotransferase [Lutibaculum baratangense]